ncbi:TPA: hypothetical protein ACHYZ4_000438 [Pseudomonas aeruginosa]
MNKVNECTCPSGDGSLVHPCPAHPAVEQAGGDERAAFEQWLEQHMSHHFSPELDLAKYEDSGEYRYNPAADYWKAWQARAALAQPYPKSGDYSDQSWINAGCPPEQPEQAEAELPEVVGYLATAEHPKHGQPHKAFNYFKDQHDAQVAHWRERGCEVSDDELMTVAQHARIVGVLRAEIAEWQEAAGRSRSDVVAYIAERAKLLEERDAAMAEVEALRAELQSQRERNTELIFKLGSATNGWGRCEKERDAALARVAELEKQEPVATVAKVPGEDWNSLDFHRDLQHMQPGTKLYAAPVARAQHSVPDGWKLVPSKPTIEMVEAGYEESLGMPDRSGHTRVMEQYEAMLAAAPGKEGV